MPDGTGSTQGDQMTGKNQTTVAVGSAGSDGVLLKKADFVAGFYEIIGAGQTDNPAADNEFQPFVYRSFFTTISCKIQIKILEVTNDPMTFILKTFNPRYMKMRGSGYEKKSNF
jgi:hypothetical protein